MTQKRIRMIIVDDDVLALTTLKMLVQVENIRIVGEFTQAVEAVEYVKNHPADLVITDMKMPKMDGIELIQSMKEYKPDLEIIAISSYKDFHYVKESFKEGSIDYILKHTLNEEVLTHALLEASKRILARRTEPEQEEDVNLQSQEALKEKIFAQLFASEMAAEKVEETLKRCRTPLDISSSILILCEIDDYASIAEEFKEDDKRIFLEAFRGMIEKVVEKVPQKIIIPVWDGCYALLLSFTGVKSQIYIYSMSAQYGRRLNENMKKMLDVELSVSMGGLCTSVKDVKSSYDQCVKMLKHKFTQGKGQVYNGYDREWDSHKETESQSSLSAVAFHGEEIYHKVQDLDDSWRQDLEAVFEYYKVQKFPMSVVELNIIEMLNTGCRLVKEQKLEALGESSNFQKLYGRIKKTATVDEIREILLGFYQEISMELLRRNQMEEQAYSKHTIKALRYMEHNYTQMISLQEAADVLGVHYAYLSKTFKQDMKCGFSEYLNKIRIEKAKELIQSQKYKIKEIYQMVGFNQYNYFFKVFKQIEGYTPAEYEKNIKKI